MLHCFPNSILLNLSENSTVKKFGLNLKAMKSHEFQLVSLSLMISLCCQIEWNSLQLIEKKHFGTLFYSGKFQNSQTKILLH